MLALDWWPSPTTCVAHVRLYRDSDQGPEPGLRGGHDPRCWPRDTLGLRAGLWARRRRGLLAAPASAAWRTRRAAGLTSAAATRASAVHHGVDFIARRVLRGVDEGRRGARHLRTRPAQPWPCSLPRPARGLEPAGLLMPRWRGGDRGHASAVCVRSLAPRAGSARVGEATRSTTRRAVGRAGTSRPPRRCGRRSATPSRTVSPRSSGGPGGGGAEAHRAAVAR